MKKSKFTDKQIAFALKQVAIEMPHSWPVQQKRFTGRE